MAKAGSTFFLRARLSMPSTGAYTEQEIPLGAFLNPLADQALVIHNIAVQIADSDNPESGPYNTGDVFNFGWNLTTSSTVSQAIWETTYLDSNSVVSSGRYSVMVGAGDEFFESDVKDMMPQDFTAGYTVAAESLFLSGLADQASTGGAWEVSIVMECSQIKLGKSEAINLALSQTN